MTYAARRELGSRIRKLSPQKLGMIVGIIMELQPEYEEVGSVFSGARCFNCGRNQLAKDGELVLRLDKLKLQTLRCLQRFVSVCDDIT